jgi:hypothetical protein
MIKISFLGDISLNDKYNDFYDDGLKPFDNIKKSLSQSDFVIGNLECMSIGKDGENLLKQPRLKTNSRTLGYLKDMHISTVTLAHNHIYDNLESGFYETKKKLNQLNISTLGAGSSQKNASEPLIVSKDNIKIAYLNYVDDDTNPNIPKSANIYLNIFNLKKIKEDINEVKKNVDYVICYLHWGGRVEKGLYPDFNQPQIAYEIIDTGADLIIGHHSHTLQPYEVYKGKYIFYSLGNFCFANIDFDGKLYEIDQDKESKSIIVDIDFKKESYAVSIKHIKNENLLILLDNSDKVEKKYNNRIKIFNFIKNKKWLWNIYWMKHRHYNPIKFYFFGNNRNPFKQFEKLGVKKIINYMLKKIKGKI